jgi:hypothetical protein
VRVETGNLTTPDGTPYRGFKITVGGLLDPENIERTYSDILRILHRNAREFRVKEERDGGKFKSLVIET